MKMFFYVCSGALLAMAPVAASTLDDGNRAFAAGKFHDSTQAYQSILDREGYSAPVLYDLGNSLVREGDVPRAIVAYQRALWLAPGDADIRANLDLAQKEAGASVTPERRLEKFAALANADEWAWIGASGWFLLCAMLLGRAIWPQGRGPLTLAAVGAALLLAVAVCGTLGASTNLRQVVVVDRNASALISPFPSAATVFTPSPGQVVTAQKSYNDFVLVSDGSGRTGWMARSQVVPVVPL